MELDVERLLLVILARRRHEKPRRNPLRGTEEGGLRHPDFLQPGADEPASLSRRRSAVRGFQ